MVTYTLVFILAIGTSTVTTVIEGFKTAKACVKAGDSLTSFSRQYSDYRCITKE